MKSNHITMPNFLIIGAGRAGTTSLYHYLNQHPQVYMSPIKETNFFAYESEDQDRLKRNSFPITSIEAYRVLFQGVTNEKAIGEASPRYISSPVAAQRIKYYIPHAKLIAILRNPVERAYSSYLMHTRDGRETRTFPQAIREEELGMADKLLYGQRHYVYLGFYYTQLVRYFNLFDRTQIAVYLFDDLKADATGVLKDIFRFLDVDEFVLDMSIRYNVSGIPANKILKPLLGRSQTTYTLRRIFPVWLRQTALNFWEAWRSRRLIKPPLSTEVRGKLIAVYREDILQLQDLIQRDLSKWLE
jgi:hypothetical protein